jgi:hypothetical protein
VIRGAGTAYESRSRTVWWYPYSLRRLRKNPAIAGYVLKSLFKS